MLKTGFTSLQVTADTRKQFEDITSLTISNYGNSDLYVKVDDVERKIPAFNPAIGVPFGSFNLPGDGTACNLEISFRFIGGQGNAILDYRKVSPQTC